MPIDGVIMNAVEDDNSVMDGVGEAPPKLAGPGETSALPPPVDAAAAGAPRSDTFAPCSVPAASEHRPDSGIELTDDECNTRTHSRFDVDERGTAKRRKFNNEQTPFSPSINQHRVLGDGSPEPSLYNQVPGGPGNASGSSQMSPANGASSDYAGEQPRSNDADEDSVYQHQTCGTHSARPEVRPLPQEAEPMYDDTFFQATELPGFRFLSRSGPTSHPAYEQPYISESQGGQQTMDDSRQPDGGPVSSDQVAPDIDQAQGTEHASSAAQTNSFLHQNIFSKGQIPTQNSAPQASTPDPMSSELDNDIAPTELVDSAFDDGASASFSITDTLESSVSHYRWENGRRYHAYRDGAYWGPNDELHNDQQDIAHKAWTLSIGDRLFMAPLDGSTLQRTLDVGTGTGLWAIEFAEMFPNAQVTGTDLSPIQPSWVPPNCMFEVDDVSMEWTFRKNSFDFIHAREMFGSIADWDFFFAQCFAHCKPGGYVECLERGVKPMSDDHTVGPDHFYTLWGNTVLEMGMRWGKGFDAWEIIKEKMESAGFVDVVETKMKWPIGGWPKDRRLRELGLWNAVRLDTGIEGYVMRLFTQAGGWSYAEVQAFLGKFRACMRDPTLHAYLPGTCVYGRKPL